MSVRKNGAQRQSGSNRRSHTHRTNLPQSDHLVQFYESDESLLRAVNDYIGGGLDSGLAVMVVASEDHRNALDAALQQSGIEVEQLRETGRYVSLDAAETISRFMVNGSPDPERFLNEIEPRIRQITAGGTPLRVFGEMVAILWSQGKRDAALRVEQLWNNLQLTTRFSLMCAYPLKSFIDAPDEALAHLCGEHSAIIDSDCLTDVPEGYACLRATVAMLQKARQLEAEIARRKELEQQVLEREAELKDFLENAADGMHRVGPDGIILWANQAELNMLGYSAEEYVGRHISEFHTTPSVIEDILRRLARNETLRNYEARLRHKDGTLRTVLISSNVRWKDGEFAYTRCITRDVTRRKRWEDAESYLAAVVESADDAIVSKTLEGVITSWNPGAEKLFGYSAVEAIGRPITMLIPPERADEEKEILAKMRRGESIEHYETQRLRKDGRLVDVSLTVSPIRNDRQQIIGASKIARDITGRKQAQAALTAYKNQLEVQVEDLKRLHEMSLAVTTSLDIDTVLREVLRATLSVQRTDLGMLSLYEAESETLKIKASSGFSEEFLKAVESVPAGSGSWLLQPRRMIIEDLETDPGFEEYREAARAAGCRAMHSTPLVTRTGRIIGVLSVHFRQPNRPSDQETRLMDLFARMAADAIENARLYHRVQEDLAEREHLLIREQLARSAAENANRMKDEFLATVSHELRTPLNAIIGWCHMLSTKSLDPKTQIRAIETIDRNAKAQAQLIEDILDVSRIITGKLQLRMERVDLSTIINAAVDSVHLAAEAKEIQWQITADPLARRISGDPGRLQQVVWNLLANAIKFTPAGGTVSLQLKRVDRDVELIVADTGEGIAPDFLPFIFDRFSQADGTLTRERGGLGLGLAIVRHLTELHGGTVRAESAGKNKGAIFILRFPLDSRSLGAQADKPPVLTSSIQVDPGNPVLSQSLEGVRILLVDDNQDTLDFLCAWLSGRKAIVQTATSVSQALAILEWYDLDVLVSDIAMPGQDGYSLIAALRRLEKDKGRVHQAIALTALVRIEDRARALSAGFNMFVPKPVDPAELASAIASIVKPDAALQPVERMQH